MRNIPIRLGGNGETHKFFAEPRKLLLDQLALKGVGFPSALFLFRKVLFTLDGVLQDVAGGAVRIDQVVAYYFLTRCIGSFGLFREPLNVKDLWPLARALL